MKLASDVQYLDIRIENRSICTTTDDKCVFYVKDDTGTSGDYQLIMLRGSEDWAVEHLVDDDATGIQINNVDSYANDAYVWYYKSGDTCLRCAQVNESNTVVTKDTSAGFHPTGITWLKFVTSIALNDGRFVMFRWYDDYAAVSISDQSVLIYEFYGNNIEDITQPQTPTAYSSDKGSAWQTPVKVNNKYYFCINAFTAGATGYQWGNYYFLTGKMNPSGSLTLSWEKFEYIGELSKAQKEFKKVMRFHMMEANNLTYLWVGVLVEDYGGSEMDFIDYYMVRDPSTGLWYVVQEEESGFYPLRPYDTHHCTLYQRGVYAHVGYWVQASTGRSAAYLAKNPYQSWDSQTIYLGCSHVSTARQRYIADSTPMTYYIYNTTTSQYDLYYEAVELLDDPPSPIGLREGVVWGTYGFILWSQFNWLLTAVYWDIQILEPGAKQRLLGVTTGATTDLSVADPGSYTVGDIITIEGAQQIVGAVVSDYEDLNGYVGAVTAKNVLGGTITIALDSSAFAAYAGGGYIDTVIVNKTIGDGVNPVQTYYEVLESDGLALSTWYEWRCRARDIRGNDSDWSDAGNDNRPRFICYDEPGIDTPTVTQNLDSQFPYVDFSTDEYRVPITSIETVIKTDPAGATVHTQTDTGSSCRLQPQQYRVIIDETSELLTATNYKATVTITNKLGYNNSATSAQFTLTFAALADPTGLTAVDQQGYIKLSWTNPGGITKYIILRDGVYFDTVSDSSATVTYYDTSCKNDQMYTYTVKSFDDKKASTGVTATCTSHVFPYYALVEKTTSEPLYDLVATDPNNLNFAASNNPESVGSVSIPTYVTLEGVLRFTTSKVLDYMGKINERFYLKTKDRVVEVLINDLTEVKGESYSKDGLIYTRLSAKWTGEIV